MKRFDVIKITALLITVYMPIVGEAQVHYGNNSIGGRTNAWGYGNETEGNYYNTVLGSMNWATKTSSVAMGENAHASGDYSTAMTYESEALGVGSVAAIAGIAAGNYSFASHWGTADGEGSMTFSGNEGTNASGKYAVAMGPNVVAGAMACWAIGAWGNWGGGNPDEWVLTDPIFEIGDATTSDPSRPNLVTILKNGNVGIFTNAPSVPLQVQSGDDVQLTEGGYLVIGNVSGTNIAIDDDEIMARNNGNTANLYLQDDGGAVYVGGSVVHTSDRRLKRDIQPLSYGLEETCQLHPISYFWRGRDNTERSIGLAAQEVQPIVKELVYRKDDKAGTLGVDYISLIPLLINAVRELNYKNKTLGESLEKLSGDSATLKKQNDLLIEQNIAAAKRIDENKKAVAERIVKLNKLQEQNRILARYLEDGKRELADTEKQTEQRNDKTTDIAKHRSMQPSGLN